MQDFTRLHDFVRVQDIERLQDRKIKSLQDFASLSLKDCRMLKNFITYSRASKLRLILPKFIFGCIL